MSRREKEKEEKKKRNAPFVIVIIIFAAVIVFCLAKVLPYFFGLYEADKNYKELAEEVEDEGNGEYDWRSVFIDFDYLQSVNEDVVAWIRFDDLDAVGIDYPVLYSQDESKYLHADWTGEYSYSGSIFIDSFNSSDFTDAQTILYGHNMRNGTMFGDLKKYRYDEEFCEENKFYTIYTPEGAYRYKIFTFFITDESSYVYRTGFEFRSDEYAEHIEKLLSEKMVETNTKANSSDLITVLSTCVSGSDDSERFVVIGKKTDEELY